MYQAPPFWLCRSRGGSTQRRAFGDENPYGAALPCSRASASPHQPNETKSATCTHGDLINRHPTDFSKSSTLPSCITKLFWWKWLKLTIIISFREAPRGFGEALARLRLHCSQNTMQRNSSPEELILQEDKAIKEQQKERHGDKKLLLKVKKQAPDRARTKPTSSGVLMRPCWLSKTKLIN